MIVTFPEGTGRKLYEKYHVWGETQLGLSLSPYQSLQTDACIASTVSFSVAAETNFFVAAVRKLSISRFSSWD